VLLRNAVLAHLAPPENLDHQGTGAVAMTVSLDAVLWRLIAADQPPGIDDAVGEKCRPAD